MRAIFEQGEREIRVPQLLLLLADGQPFLPSLSLSLLLSRCLSRDPYYASLLDFIIREMSRAGINSRAQASGLRTRYANVQKRRSRVRCGCIRGIPR